MSVRCRRYCRYFQQYSAQHRLTTARSFLYLNMIIIFNRIYFCLIPHSTKCHYEHMP